MPFDRTVCKNPEVGLPVRIHRHASQPARSGELAEGNLQAGEELRLKTENQLLQPRLISQSPLRRLFPPTVHVGPVMRERSE